MVMVSNPIQERCDIMLSLQKKYLMLIRLFVVVIGLAAASAFNKPQIISQPHKLMHATITDDVNTTTEQQGISCYYKRIDGSWKPRKELNSLFIGERLYATRLIESDLLDGKSGPKLFLECGVGKRNNNRWSIINGMLRIGKKGMKKGVMRKKIKKIPPNKLIEVYVSRIRVEEGTFEVCLNKDDALQKGDIAKQRISASSLKVGEELNGVVRSVHPYGVFVDVNANRNGLLHISKVAKAHDTFVDKEDGLKRWGLARESQVYVRVLSNEKKRLELDLVPPPTEVVQEADVAEEADEDDMIDDTSASNIIDEEQAMWAAYAAADYATNSDKEDEYDEDADIEDSLGIGSW